MTSPDTNETKPIDMKLIVNIAYGLFAVGILTGGYFGVSTLAAMVLIYVKRADASGTVYAMHFDWMTQTFWWGLLWLALSGLATYIYIGWAAIVATAIWVLYRLTKGWLAHLEGRSPATS